MEGNTIVSNLHFESRRTEQYRSDYEATPLKVWAGHKLRRSGHLFIRNLISSLLNRLSPVSYPDALSFRTV